MIFFNILYLLRFFLICFIFFKCVFFYGDEGGVLYVYDYDYILFFIFDKV